MQNKFHALFKAHNFYLLLGIYVIVYLVFLHVNNYLPYVLDNNETYSSLVHAFNMYYGDWGKHFGLTDEAFSPFPEAHPIIHTHQGNWPRLFAFILFCLGARTAESQIILHVFSIGIVAVWLMYRFFSKITNSRFAFIACFFLITDYMLFMQWHVVTYRVWHCFFIFSSMNCILEAQSKRTLHRILFILNFMALFYWELVFAFYVSFWSLLFYSLYQNEFMGLLWIKKIFLMGCKIAASGLLGLLMLFSQLAAFMGIKNVFQDYYLTFLARNFTKDPEKYKEILIKFYADKDVAFFFNIVDGKSYHNIKAFIRSISNYGLQYHTPILSLLSVFVLLSFLISGWKNFAKLDELVLSYRKSIILTSIPLAALISILYSSTAFLGVKSSISFLVLGMLPIICIISFYLSKLIYSIADQHANGFTFRKVLSVNIILVLFSGLLLTQPILYIEHQSTIWLNSLTYTLPIDIWRILLIFITVSLCISILTGFSFVHKLFKLNNIFVFLNAAIFSYIIVYTLSPGYIFSGYLIRTAPFIVFFINLLPAILISYLIAFSIYLLKLYNFKTILTLLDIRGKYSVAVMFRYLAIACALFCVTTICLYWVAIQVKYAKLFPGDTLNFIKILRKDEFKNKSIVSNQYALPFAYEAKYWAFTDPNIGRNTLKLNEQGYTTEVSFDYLWYKDRYNNTKYSTPEYFICFIPNTIDNVVSRIRSGVTVANSCSSNTTITQALIANSYAQDEPKLFHKIIFEDAKNKSWAIMRMDWDFPPYLKKNNENNMYLSVNYESVSKNLQINYVFQQQNGSIEQYTNFKIFSNDKHSKLLLEKNAKGGVLNLNINLSKIKNIKIIATPVSNNKFGQEITQLFSEDKQPGEKKS